MADLWQVLLQNLGGRLDEELLPRLYDTAGLSASDVRAELRELGLPFLDPLTGSLPTMGELDASAEVVLSRATNTATVGGAVAGFAGALALPPELVGSLVQTLRLGQRLAVIYGHDTDTARGRLVLWRAVAAAWDLKVARQGPLDLRVSNLPQLLASQLSDVKVELPSLARTLTVRAVVTAGRRTLRLLPGLGAGLGAWDARRRVLDQGRRMVPVLRRACEHAPAPDGPIEDAVEVRRGGPSR